MTNMVKDRPSFRLYLILLAAIFALYIVTGCKDKDPSGVDRPSDMSPTHVSNPQGEVTETICFTENGERVCYDADHPKASKEYRMKISGGKLPETSTPPEAESECVSVKSFSHCSNLTDFSIPPSEGPFLATSMNSDHACAVREKDNIVICAGNNNYGQSTPPDDTFQSTIVIDDWTCGHTTRGSILCWGNTESNPMANPPTDTFKRSYLGFHSKQSCGIRQDDTIVCWGNFSPELPPEPPTGTFKELALGVSHHCALRIDNTLTCWGDNSHGQSMPPTGKFQNVSTFGDYSCALSQGTAKRQCWGDYPFKSNK